MSQTEKLYNLLLDGEPHRTDRILESVYGGGHLGCARIGSRIFDVKNKYNVEIESWKDKETPSLWWYQIKQKDTLFNIPEKRVVSDKDILKFR